MAKGNIGNLLQHFVSLRASSAFVGLLPNKNPAIEYIDTFSMAPWEAIRPSPFNAVFKDIVDTFPEKHRTGDFAASTFTSGWLQRYGDLLPPNPLRREYPNTAVLFRLGFPDVQWRMRLHDKEASIRQQLEAWAATQTGLNCRVADQWDKSDLIKRSPIPDNSPVIVMLDPNKIMRADNKIMRADNKIMRADDEAKQNLSDSQLRYMMAGLCLDLQKRPSRTAVEPAMVLAFSYSDSRPDVPHGIIEQVFKQHGWSITRIATGPHRVHTNDVFHQGWILSSSQQLLPDLQHEWNVWSNRLQDGQF